MGMSIVSNQFFLETRFITLYNYAFRKPIHDAEKILHGTEFRKSKNQWENCVWESDCNIMM